MINHFYVYCMDRDFGPLFLDRPLTGRVWFEEATLASSLSSPSQPPAANLGGTTSGPDGNLWFTESNKIGQVVLAPAAPSSVPTLSAWSLALCGILLLTLGAWALLARPSQDTVSQR